MLFIGTRFSNLYTLQPLHLPTKSVPQNNYYVLLCKVTTQEYF